MCYTCSPSARPALLLSLLCPFFCISECPPLQLAESFFLYGASETVEPVMQVTKQYLSPAQ